jgi:hypothetical protein
MEKLFSIFLGRRYKYKTHYMFENPAPGEAPKPRPPLRICCFVKPIYTEELGR